MGLRIYRCLASLEGAPEGSPAGGGGGGVEAVVAGAHGPDGLASGRGGRWRRSRGRRWQRGRHSPTYVGHRLGQLRVGEERMRKREKGKRGAHGLLDQDPTAVHVD
jgi:hypothetical protein